MAYRITLSLGRLDEECTRQTLTPEDAALAAWQMCVDHGLQMPNSSWRMKTWDTFEGQYETNPVTDQMVRGGGGTYPDRVEFCHAVIDQLTENCNDARASSIFAAAKFPYTKEPGGAKPKFEMFRGSQDRLLIEYHEDSKWSVVDDFASKLEDVRKTAEAVGELDELAKLLEEKMQEIQTTKKRKKMDAVE
ncbi:hypothetical protein ACHAXR_006938 [Thalassiosira sp. AJA248-18]